MNKKWTKVDVCFSVKKLSLSLCLSLSIFLVISCLLITLNKCLKGHKALGLLLGGVLKMSLSLSLSLSLSNLFWSCHVFSLL